MNAARNTLRNVIVAAAAVLAGGALVGCDDGLGGWDGGYGDDPGYGYHSGSYGPIDDDVFQNAADAWSDYIRS